MHQSKTFNLGQPAAALLLLVSWHHGAVAQALPDYRCTIDRVAIAELGHTSVLKMQEKNYLGKQFSVERRTGVMSGTLKNPHHGRYGLFPYIGSQ